MVMIEALGEIRVALCLLHTIQQGKKIPIPKTFTVFERQGRKKVEETQTQLSSKSMSKQQVHDEISSRIDASHIPDQYLVHKIIIF